MSTLAVHNMVTIADHQSYRSRLEHSADGAVASSPGKSA